MTTTVRRRRLPGWVIPVISALLAVYGVAYLTWAAYLVVFAEEGVLPPRWRIPDVPGGAQVISETKGCGSGGCWRELVVRPESGQSPDELATEMGVADFYRESWLVYDPHTVSIGSSARDRDLVIYVQY